VGYEQIRYEKHDRVGVITLDRPRVRNAQSQRLLEELDAAFAEAGADDGVRAVILAGEGEHFSSGHDLGTAEELADRKARPWPKGPRGEFERSWSLYVESSLRWRDLPKPTIAHGFLQAPREIFGPAFYRERRCPNSCRPYRLCWLRLSWPRLISRRWKPANRFPGFLAPSRG